MSKAGHKTWRAETTDRTAIARHFNVSRETEEKLQIYVDLLIKWQAKINLISSRTLPIIWHRHILDSAQLLSYLPKEPAKILDIGSGAGLPGVILAILSDHDLHLVESDSRKAAFMRHVLRETSCQATLYEERIEKMAPLSVDMITARALAPLSVLMTWTQPHHHADLHYLFLKGKDAKEELTDWTAYPTLEAELYPSITDSEASIIHLKPVLSIKNK